MTRPPPGMLHKPLTSCNTVGAPGVPEGSQGIVVFGGQVMAGKRPTAVRDKRRTVIGRGRPPCALCGQPIDYSLAYPDPGAFVVDDIIPLARGGEYTLANGQAAHNLCNRLKSDKLIAPVIKRSGSLVRPLGG